MNTLKDNKKNSINYFEYFILRILKNGQKYKYLKLLKNIFLLFSKQCYINRFNISPNNYLSNSILNSESLEFNSHNYTFIIKSVYKKKKRKKYINVTQLNFNHSKEKELYKLLYYILYKLNIRTFQLRLYYLVYVFNFRFFRRINLYKKLKSYYYKQLKKQRKKYRFISHKTMFYGQPTFCFKKLKKISYTLLDGFHKYPCNTLNLKFRDKLQKKLLFKYYFYLTSFRKNCGNIYLRKRPFKKKVKKSLNTLVTTKIFRKDILKTNHKMIYSKLLFFGRKCLLKKYLLFTNFKYNRRDFLYKTYFNLNYKRNMYKVCQPPL